MPELQAFPLVTRSGRKGRVFRASRFLDRSNVNRIQLDDGTDTSVLASDLTIQPDGTFLLDDSDVEGEVLATPAPAASTEAPPVAAQADEPTPAPQPPSVEPQIPEARTENLSAARDVEFDEPLFVEDVQVERVPINRIVDAPPQTRQEGDTTVVPVIEEVITVQKKLLLKEEVRITRRRTEVRQPRTVRMDKEQSRVVGADGRDIDVR